MMADKDYHNNKKYGHAKQEASSAPEQHPAEEARHPQQHLTIVDLQEVCFSIASRYAKY